MRRIIRHILNEETNLQIRVKKLMSEVGFVKACKIVGGFYNLVRILSEEYFTKDKVVKMIGDISSEFGEDGKIYFYDYEIEISLGRDVYNDGSYQETSIFYVDKNEEYYSKTWMYDEDGHMFDEPDDDGVGYLDELDLSTLHKILNNIVQVFNI
jgi:hypothetical protein